MLFLFVLQFRVYLKLASYKDYGGGGSFHLLISYYIETSD